MKTKYFILLLALPLLFAGCSKDDDDPGTGGGNTWKVKYEIVPVNPSDTNIQGHGIYFSSPKKGNIRYSYLNGEIFMEGSYTDASLLEVDVEGERATWVDIPWSVEVNVGDGIPRLSVGLSGVQESGSGAYIRIYIDGILYKEAEINFAGEIDCLELACFTHVKS